MIIAEFNRVAVKFQKHASWTLLMQVRDDDNIYYTSIYSCDDLNLFYVLSIF
jgi:hypothetical protein